MNKLVILGAGQQGRNCKRLAPFNDCEVVAFVDDYVRGTVEGISVHKKIADVPNYKECKYIIAVGDMDVREKFEFMINTLELECVNLIDPTAEIEEGAIIGTGNYIYKFVSIYASARIGDHNIINSKALIATDAVIGNNCDIRMGSNVCGAVEIGDCSIVGYNSTVKSGVKVGEYAEIDACSYVVDDVKDGDVVSGVPAI